MNEFRLLKADEIEARVAMVKANGLQLLLYKDARCDMAILDETVGPLNWTRKHSRDNANCTVSIWDPDKGQWIDKEDTGTESNTEAEKGLASDSFKRACVNWGIGRELYTAPFIWFPAEDVKIVSGKCSDKFDVVDIQYDGRKIKTVTIADTTTKKRKTFGTTAQQSVAGRKPAAETEPARSDIVTLKGMCQEYGMPEEFVAGLYKRATIDELKPEETSYLISEKGWDKARRRFLGE